MADIDLKTLTPDTSLPTTGFLFGADSQASTNPSVYSTQTVATTLLGSTSLTGDTLTADAPVLNLAQTWNNAAVTFTGVRFNAAGSSSTNSASGSLLADLQIGGTSKLAVAKDGSLSIFNAGVTTVRLANTTYGLIALNNSGVQLSSDVANNFIAACSSMNFSSGGPLSWSSDTFITRKNTRILQLGAADAATALAQTLSVQSVVAGTTDGAGAAFTITGSQGTGTGAGGSIVFQVAPAAGSSGNAQNTLAEALTIASTKLVTLTGDLGLYSSNTLRIGSSTVNWQITAATTGIVQGSANYYGFFDGTNLASGGSIDTRLYRDAANTLALRNGVNAQTFRVYNTYTDASNYARLNVGWEATGALISFTAAGTGNAAQSTRISSNGAILNIGSSGGFVFGSAGANWWSITSSGNLVASTDNTYDIGAVSATRPRSVYVGTSITPGAGVIVASLPTPTTGMVARVTDALAPTIGTTVAGGGAAYALVNYNGANWTVIGV